MAISFPKSSEYAKLIGQLSVEPAVPLPEESPKYRLDVDHPRKRSGAQSMLYRIVALKNFGDVKKGDVGGWVASDRCLSQSGKCWVYDDAVVEPFGRVQGDALVKGSSVVARAEVNGTAVVVDSRVEGGSLVAHNALVSRCSLVTGGSVVAGNADVEDSVIDGRCRIGGNSVVTECSLKSCVLIPMATSEDSPVLQRVKSSSMLFAAGKGTIKDAVFGNDETFSVSVSLPKANSDWTATESISVILPYGLYSTSDGFGQLTHDDMPGLVSALKSRSAEFREKSTKLLFQAGKLDELVKKLEKEHEK